VIGAAVMVKQSKHRSHIDFWHRVCAEEYFEAPVPGPGADGRSRLTVMPSEWP
jgi:hypothetical protein